MVVKGFSMSFTYGRLKFYTELFTLDEMEMLKEFRTTMMVLSHLPASQYDQNENFMKWLGRRTGVPIQSKLMNFPYLDGPDRYPIREVTMIPTPDLKASEVIEACRDLLTEGIEWKEGLMNYLFLTLANHPVDSLPTRLFVMMDEKPLFRSLIALNMDENVLMHEIILHNKAIAEEKNQMDAYEIEMYETLAKGKESMLIEKVRNRTHSEQMVNAIQIQIANAKSKNEGK